MKSRTSSFNLTVLKKDITRFAPAWALYAVFLLLMFMVVVYSMSNYSAQGVFGTTYALSIINCAYALLCGQLLFGDLFSARMANALHAMPVRRETWFASHMLSGLLFSLIPNILFALIVIPACLSVPALPWLWLLTNMCQYLFFFGLAAACAQCVGSRFAMVVVYGLANFGSLVVYWLLDSLYIPRLPGVVLNAEPFLKWSPVVYGTVNIPYERYFTGRYPDETWYLEIRPEILAYTGILAALGIVLAVAALVLYRRRHLESAGDFIAAGWMKPVFLILYTLMMGAVFQFILGMFGNELGNIYLTFGVVVGYFTGQMLLKRTTRVFEKKTLAGFAAFAAVLLLSLGLTVMDPLGIAKWVPEPEDVASVTINHEESDDPEVIRGMTQIHGILVSGEQEPGKNATALNLTYTMKDGSQVLRYYILTQGGEAHRMLEPIMSRPEFVLETLADDPDQVDHITVTDFEGNYVKLSKDQIRALIQAITLDCEAGTMAQGNYHVNKQDDGAQYLYFEIFDPETVSYRHVMVYVYEDAEHTVAWLKQQGLYKAATTLK